MFSWHNVFVLLFESWNYKLKEKGEKKKKT